MRELSGAGRRGTRARRAPVRARPAATWTPAAGLLSNSSPRALGGLQAARRQEDPAWAGEPSKVARLVHEHKALALNSPKCVWGSPAFKTQALNYMGFSCRIRNAGLLIPLAPFLLPAKRKKRKERKRNPKKTQNPRNCMQEKPLRLRSQALDALGASFS